MDLDILETVLKDILEDLKVNNEIVQELTTRTGSLEDKILAFEKMLEKSKIVAPPADTKTLQDIAQNYFREFCRIVEAQPKNVVNESRFMLFPETNTDRYYKIVFGRLIPWSYGMVAALLLISLGKQYIRSRVEERERRYYYEVYTRAWKLLEDTTDKKGRKKMEEVLQKSVDEAEKSGNN